MRTWMLMVRGRLLSRRRLLAAPLAAPALLVHPAGSHGVGVGAPDGEPSVGGARPGGRQELEQARGPGAVVGPRVEGASGFAGGLAPEGGAVAVGGAGQV